MQNDHQEILARASRYQLEILTMISAKEADQYRISGNPTGRFWEAWNAGSKKLKAAGFYLSKTDAGWKAGIFIRDLEGGMDEQTASKQAAKQASEAAFWGDRNLSGHLNGGR